MKNSPGPTAPPYKLKDGFLVHKEYTHFLDSSQSKDYRPLVLLDDFDAKEDRYGACEDNENDRDDCEENCGGAATDVRVSGRVSLSLRHNVVAPIHDRNHLLTRA